jgi:hypothetical protein
MGLTFLVRTHDFPTCAQLTDYATDELSLNVWLPSGVAGLAAVLQLQAIGLYSAVVPRGAVGKKRWLGRG